MALNLTGYHLTFDDEFNSFLPTELGGSTWDVTIFSGGYTWGSENYSLGPDGGINAYLASGGVDPFSVGNGVLSITATPNVPGSTSNYTTGLIDNRGSFSQTYGYFEMRAELPAGSGMWPAFWMLPTIDQTGGAPEIDVLEAFGSQYGWYGGSNQVHFDLHSDTNPYTRGDWATVNANIYDSYNTYGVMWTPTALTFYFDGQAIGSLPTSADLVGNPGQYLIASLLTGSPYAWPGAMEGETGSLKIDYIRAYSSSSAIPAVPLQTVSSPDGGGNDLYGATAANGTTGNDSGTTSYSGGTPIATLTPAVTISSEWGTSATVDLSYSSTANDNSFNVIGADTISAVLGANAQTLSFTNTAGVTVKGGSGYATISVAGGTNDFTAGSGGMTIASAGGDNTFHLVRGMGQMTIQDFTDSDTIAADPSLLGRIRETSSADGTLLKIGTRGGSVNSIYLPNVQHFDMNSIQYSS